MNPKHINKVPEYIKDDKGNNIPRRAVAPYNFVELPEKVVEAQPLPDQSFYHDYSEHLIKGETVKIKRHTGRIECTLTTESKLYTRCGCNPEDFAKYSEPPTHKTKEEREQWEKEEKPKWEKERRDILALFFSYPSSSLMAIPGSSIRGMLRTLVEIVSFSKIERVTDRKLFYRSLGDRAQNGYLRDGEPVFFLLNNDNKVRFLGRAQMFRLPYNNSPLDFVPVRLRFPILKVLAIYFKMLFINQQSVKYATLIALFTSFVDIADAIFGFIGNKKLNSSKAYASRVYITDGLLKSDQKEKVQASLDRKPEQILLSSPKPTTFQHYLVQPKETKAHQENLKHYASQPPIDTESGETVIRGHKLYWHRDCKIEVPENADTQTSLIKPIDSGIEFTFTIHFENLSDVELGALLWVLSLSSDKSQTLETGKPDETYCFSLGMGKPFGMGAVKIDYKLYLSDRIARYSQLFDRKGWSQDEKDQDEVTQEEIKCISEFEKYILDRISENDYPDKHNRQQLEHLKQIPRIEMLLAMLQCDSPPEATDYMELDDFKSRKVLPTPLDIMDIPDNRRQNNPFPLPSISGGTGGNSSSSGNTPKPKLKRSDKNQPIKKSLQFEQQRKPKDNSEGSNSAAWARPPKPKP